MTIRVKLLACISLQTAALIIISGFSFYAMRAEGEIANSIVSDRVIPMEQLKRIGDGYAVSIVDTAHKVRSGALSPEQGLKSVDEALLTIEDHWTAYIATELTAEERQIADHFAQVRTEANEGVDELRRILASGDLSTLAEFADKKLYPTIDPLGADISRLIDLQIEVSKQNLADGDELSAALTALMVALSSMGAVVAGLSIWTVLRGVLKPVNSITQAMAELAGGNLDVAIYGEGRKDEIGKMASTVAVFRDNAQERVRLEREAEANRSLGERERLERERQQAQEAAEVRFAVDSIGHALGQLSNGKLNYRIETVFAERLDQVRVDFNDAVSRLEDAMRTVGQNAQAIAAGSNQIRAAAEYASE